MTTNHRLEQDMPARSRARRGLPALAVVLALLAGCAPAAPGGAANASEITDPTAQLARSATGVVASASVYATEVGARVLAEGGNAVDAAVATAFTLAVTEPSMSGLGGRASTLVRLPDGTVVGFNGLNQVPQGYRAGTDALPGYERAATPGVPATLVQLHEAHGSLPLARVMAGAIRLAEEGFVLPPDEAGRWAGAAEELASYPASQAIWLRPDGSPFRGGDRFRNPALARTLRAIAERGREGFYGGWVADSIHADMTRNGGFITRDELAGFRALPAIPARGNYRGYAVLSNFRPASGHTVVEALHIMQEVELPGLDREAAWAAVVSQAMQIALGERSGDFGSEEESARVLTSREHARERARGVQVPARVDERAPAGVGAASWPGEGGAPEPWRGEGRGPAFGEDAFQAPRGTLVSAPGDRENTTHLAVADAQGMVVTHTQSNGPSLGTRLTASGLGFFYATRLGSTPGSRPSSTIAPTLVLHPDGRPWFALGGAGDSRILSAVIQIVSRRIDHGMSLEDAVRAPRVHPGEARAMSAEAGPVSAWDEEDLARLVGWGFEPEATPSGFFGRSHAVELEGGTILGVAEPRWTGSAVGVRR